VKAEAAYFLSLPPKVSASTASASLVAAVRAAPSRLVDLPGGGGHPQGAEREGDTGSMKDYQVILPLFPPDPEF